jgi:hypothetical protein
MPGCNKRVVSNGLCDTHRKRVERHGSTEQTRAADWGKREKHPLYHAWLWYVHFRKSLLCERWHDFWNFVEDAGERPSPDYKLRRIDENKNYCKENCEWVECVKGSGSDGEYRREYAKLWRTKNQDKTKAINVRKLGLSILQYNLLEKGQHGLCAICGKQEHVMVKSTGKPRALAVDHNHETGDIRGLLCTNCNKALGHFKDNVELLAKAIVYLQKEPAIPFSKTSLKVVN